MVLSYNPLNNSSLNPKSTGTLYKTPQPGLSSVMKGRTYDGPQEGLTETKDSNVSRVLYSLHHSFFLHLSFIPSQDRLASFTQDEITAPEPRIS